MKNKSFLFICLFIFSCAKPQLVYYSPDRYDPKPAGYSPAILQPGQQSEKPYKIIGRITYNQDPMTANEQKVIDNLLQGCRQMGGDGLLNIHKEKVDPDNPLMEIGWTAEVFVWQK